MVKDPVCGMMVDKSSPPARTTYKDKEYFFCSNLCKIAFDMEPEKYINKEQQQQEEKDED